METSKIIETGSRKIRWLIVYVSPVCQYSVVLCDVYLSSTWEVEVSSFCNNICAAC